MRNIDIKVVEDMLEGKISKNPNRFEAANGIVFSVRGTNVGIEEYFNGIGVEYHELVKGIYYTETIMSVSEFSQLKHVAQVRHIA